MRIIKQVLKHKNIGGKLYEKVVLNKDCTTLDEINPNKAYYKGMIMERQQIPNLKKNNKNAILQKFDERSKSVQPIHY